MASMTSTDRANVKLHHMTLKAVAKAGLEVIKDPDAVAGFRLLDPETGHLSKDSYASGGEITEELAFHKGDGSKIEWLVPKAETNRNMSGAMPRVYHDKYSKNPEGPGCNDSLDVSLRDFLTVTDGAKASAKHLDTAKMKEIGVACGMWREAWESLNPGMQRMNLANRIRGWLRRDPNAELAIGETAGRFGIAHVAPKKSKAKKKVEARAVETLVQMPRRVRPRKNGWVYSVRNPAPAQLAA